MSHTPDVGAAAGGSGGKSSRRGSLVTGARAGGSGSKAGTGGLDDPFAGGGGGAGGSGSGSRAFANALLRSPQSPSKKRSYGDRFIPNREGVDLSTSYQLRDEGPPTPTRGSASKRRIVAAVTDLERDEANRTFSALLRSETFGNDSNDSASHVSGSPTHSRHSSWAAGGGSPATPRRNGAGNLFSYASPARKRVIGLDSPTHDRYSTSPVRHESQRILLSPRKQTRTLSKVPFKVLDAPELADDYYLNLVDWSSTNVLGVGLGAQVYLWSAQTSAVTKLVDLSQDHHDSVTSLSWVSKGSTLAVGCESGKVQIWDAATQKLLRTMRGHANRVGCMDWNDSIVSTGSRDKTVLHRDVRSSEHFVAKLTSHKQEVCGLKWNRTTKQLATGGNDNRVFVWDNLVTTPLHRFNEHTAAIKALAWNPHQNGVLASGGGTADKRIRFWSTLTGSMLNEIDTGSQVCALMWSKTSNELVSTHGFSAGPIQNQICLWKYPSMQQVATLSGHTYRVLYLAMSPDGQTIVTGAGDETLRFWTAFPRSKSERKSESSVILNPFSKMR